MKTPLITFEEMRERTLRGEDPFDLTVEKWMRIKRFVEEVSDPAEFQSLPHAASLVVPFCFKYQVLLCKGCPLFGLCGAGKGERFLRIVRLIHAYAIAGDILPKEILLSEIDEIILEVEAERAKYKGLYQ